MTEQRQIGAESSEVTREKPMPNIGPGHVQYGHGQRFANNRGAGGNLPFTQKIQDEEATE